MLWIVEVCAVVECLAVVAIAVATVRAMRRLEKVTDEVSTLVGEIRPWIGEAGELTREARATLSSIRGSIDPISRVAARFETLGERAADLSAAVLGEVEAPLNTAVAVARTMKSIAAFVLQRFSHKLTRGPSAKNGEHDGP